jgi:hypothetical protein
MLKSERLASVHQMIADPPRVHSKDPVSGNEPRDGVWQTDVTCYEFLAAHCEPGMRTLETGLGISTVLFARWRCRHTCIVPWKDEYNRLSNYLRDRQIDDSTLDIKIGYSADILPGLECTPLDAVFIDGGHGFPTAIIDWYYAAGRLVDGGLLVIDDLELPSVTVGLLSFLEDDPRWETLEVNTKWGAWSRKSHGSLQEEWTAQPFISPH